jgi:hypothetical protein
MVPLAEKMSSDPKPKSKSFGAALTNESIRAIGGAGIEKILLKNYG